MSGEDLEGRIRRIEGVLSCEMTDTEVVILLAEGAKAAAIGSLVAHLVRTQDGGRIVRIMTVAPAAESSPGQWARAGWVTAGVFAVAVIALLIALLNDDDNDTSRVASPVRATSTSSPRTTATTAISTTLTTAAPTTTTVAPTTTSTTTPPPAFALERHECRQDNSTLTGRGAIVNELTSTHSYRITVRFLNGSGRVAATGTADVARVAPRERRGWTVQLDYGDNLFASGGSCRASATVVS